MNVVRLLCHSFWCAVLAAGSAALAAITPVRIEQTVEPEFPAALSLSPLTSGDARVIINVDDQGHLADLLVAGYTHKAFADEAVRVLRLWRYGAATVEGHPVGVRMELHFNFSAAGRVVSLNVLDSMNALLTAMGTRSAVSTICRPDELDQTLIAVKAVAPPKPAIAVAPDGMRQHSVVLDFYVDDQGKARMPVVLQSPHLAYAEAAVDALGQWRFSTPTCGGQPVAVRVRQEFIFTNGS